MLESPFVGFGVDSGISNTVGREGPVFEQSEGLVLERSEGLVLERREGMTEFIKNRGNSGTFSS